MHVHVCVCVCVSKMGKPRPQCGGKQWKLRGCSPGVWPRCVRAMHRSPGVPDASPMMGRRCPLCQSHPARGFGRTEEVPMLIASVTAGASRGNEGDRRLINNPRVMGGCEEL